MPHRDSRSGARTSRATWGKTAILTVLLRSAMKVAMMLSLGFPLSVAADTQHPLESLDFSTPRASLNIFLTTGDRALSLVRVQCWDNPNRESSDRLRALVADMQSALDLSETPPAAQWDLGRDTVFHLYEVLSRIELPSEPEIPNATVFDSPAPASLKETEENGAQIRSASGTIPHTDITLVRIHEGPIILPMLSPTSVRSEETPCLHTALMSHNF